jgi:cytochrome c
MSDLRANKILGAVLATGLVILGLQQVSGVLFHTEGPEKPGYAIEIQEEAEGGAAAAEVPPDWGTVLPTADVAAGETVFGKCMSCHTDTPGGPNLTGPNLYNLINRKPGAHAGFAYSTAMVDFGNANPAWDYQHLSDFLSAPQAHIKGTKMTFVGLKKVEDRINILAYFRTMAPSPPPIPAPNPAAAAAAAPAAETATSGAATGADGAPTAAPEGAPANAATAAPGGQAPTAGAAAAPTATTTTGTAAAH